MMMVKDDLFGPSKASPIFFYPSGVPSGGWKNARKQEKEKKVVCV